METDDKKELKYELEHNLKMLFKSLIFYNNINTILNL